MMAGSTNAGCCYSPELETMTKYEQPLLRRSQEHNSFWKQEKVTACKESLIGSPGVVAFREGTQTTNGDR